MPTKTKPAPVVLPQHACYLADLLSAFVNRVPVSFYYGFVRWDFSVINSLEHEDGSGKSFNVTGYLHNGKISTLHVTTK